MTNKNNKAERNADIWCSALIFNANVNLDYTWMICFASKIKLLAILVPKKELSQNVYPRTSDIWLVETFARQLTFLFN